VSKEVRHPIFARLYDRMSRGEEDKTEAAVHRDELLAGLEGRVIEVGAGNGLNFKHYPATVTEVVAVEPEDYLRALAEKEAAGADASVTVVDGLADRLPATDASFDAGVASLVLCSVPDQRIALAELRRVIKPGGELRFYEHVLAEQAGMARVQRIVGKVWPFFAGGCHADRDTAGAIEAAGFEIETCRRFPFRPSLIEYPVTPRILGAARRA
jgi:ubiquinone/menaquinone biosynthesis C-methylase UbiE